MAVDSTVASEIDYAMALSGLLRAATKDVHADVEGMQAVGWIVRGELSKDEYVRFLIMLYHVYDALEVAIEKHATHPALAPTYNPVLLARATHLEADIAYLLNVPESEWKYHPLHQQFLLSHPVSVAAYVQRIRLLSDGDASTPPQPERLLAHAYVRYAGDLSGGQVICRSVAKAYGLKEDSDAGVSFYAFKKLGKAGDSTNATIGDMRKIKEWFRQGMDEGAGEDKSTKLEIVAEAIEAFRLNMGLFASLRAPERQVTEAKLESATGLGASLATRTPFGRYGLLSRLFPGSVFPYLDVIFLSILLVALGTYFVRVYNSAL